MSACLPQTPVVGKQQSCTGERDAIASGIRLSLLGPRIRALPIFYMR
jgi:hypothetical protein